MSIPPVLKDRFYSWKDRSQTVSTDTHNIKILSTANTMLFPGSCEMMTFPLNFSLQIAALQEAPLSITLQYYLQIFLEKKKIKSILTLIDHLSFVLPQCLYLISFCYPSALPFYTLHQLTKYIQDTSTLEIALILKSKR